MKRSVSRRMFVTRGASFAALTSGLLVGCSSSDSSSDEEEIADEIAEEIGEELTEDVIEDAENAVGINGAAATDVLIVGFDSEYPPYGYVGDDGEYTGFDIELACEVASRNGWEIQLEPIDWDAKDTLLNSGVINCIWNGFTYEGREDDYTFSDLYMINEQVVVVKADSEMASLEDLAGKNVITQVDSAAYEVLEGDQADLAATFASFETIGDYNTAFMQLESGAVDAVACDLSIAAYQIAANPDAYVQLGTLSSEHYAVGLALGDTDTAEDINAMLQVLDDTGFIEELCEKYADQGISYDNWCLGSN